MNESTSHPRHIVRGSDGGGAPAKPPAPDAMQVLSGGRYVSPDLTLFEDFDPDRESPIGGDDRTPVPDPEDVPWRKICQISFRASNGFPARGTGWLVGPRTIVTAGHNLLAISADSPEKLSTQVKVTPGRASKQSAPFGVFDAARLSVHEKWASERSPDFDIGCIHLAEPIGDKVGWFTFADFDDEVLENASVNIAGYPLKGPNDERLQGMAPYFHANRIKEVRDRRIFYEVDTTGGQSGAPVWLRERPEDPPMVVGIHAYGETEDVAEEEIGEVNSATRINEEIVKLIQSWIEEDRMPTEPIAVASHTPPDAAQGSGVAAAGSESAMIEFRQFMTENGSTAARVLESATESGTLTNPLADHAVAALTTTVSKFEGLIGRLLRRSRVQQRLDLYASIGTLILSSSLFAAAQTDADTRIKFVIGLLTILFAVVALIAKRMGGGEGGLVAKYIELKSLAFESRLLADTIRIKAANGQAQIDAEIEQALTATRKLAEERSWMQASDFLFRDGGWMMRRLGDVEDET